MWDCILKNIYSIRWILVVNWFQKPSSACSLKPPCKPLQPSALHGDAVYPILHIWAGSFFLNFYIKKTRFVSFIFTFLKLIFLFFKNTIETFSFFNTDLILSYKKTWLWLLLKMIIILNLPSLLLSLVLQASSTIIPTTQWRCRHSSALEIWKLCTIM